MNNLYLILMVVAYICFVLGMPDVNIEEEDKKDIEL